MTPFTRGLVLLGLCLGLLSGTYFTYQGSLATYAHMSDTEFAQAYFSGNVPIGTCAVFWANNTGQKDTLKITGSNHLFKGCLHSNHDFALGGGSNVFERTIRYVSTYGNNSNGHLLMKGVVQVAAEPYPFPYDLAQYAPGGCKAEAARAKGEYYEHSGNVQIKGGPLRTGLHYVVGSASVELDGFTGSITVVATGTIKLSTGVAGGRAYEDDLIAFANAAGPNTLTFGSNGGTVEGNFYAPNGAISFSGQSLTYIGQVSGDTVTVSGGSSVFSAKSPARTNLC